MRRRSAIVALVAAATLPAAHHSLHARARQAPAAPSSPSVQSSAPQKPSAPAEPPSSSAQPPASAGQKPAPAAGAAAAQSKEKAAEPGSIVFASTAGMVFSPIKPDQTGAYEEVLAKVQEALAKSTDPIRKQQAAGWKVYKAAEPFQNNTLYISVMDPAVKDGNYSVFSILQETYGDTAAREIYEKFRNAHAGGQNVSNVTPVFLMTTGKVVPKEP